MIEGKPAKEPYLSFYTGGAKIVSFSKDGQRAGDRGLRESLRTGRGPEGPSAGRRAEPAQPGLDLRRLGETEEGGHVRRRGRHLLRRAGAIWAEEVPLDPRPGDRHGRKPLRRLRFRNVVQRLDRSLRPLGKTALGRPRPGQLARHGLHRPGRRDHRLHQRERLQDGLDQPAGHEQSLAGFTVDRFKYPTDNRVTEGHGPAHRLINGVRRIGGKLFLFCGGQGTGSLEIYKFGKGFVAAPCGYVAGASTWRPGGGKRWPEDAESFIWTDNNNDGIADPGEFASVERKPRWGSMHLDANAGIWQCRRRPSGTSRAKVSTRAATRSTVGRPR